MTAKTPAEVIRSDALRLIAADGLRVAARLAMAHGISRQAANRHLQALVQEGVLTAAGNTGARRYQLAILHEAIRDYPCAGLSEDTVWREVFAPLLADLPLNVREIWQYGITEMVNNAIDHSGSATVEVGLRRNALDTFAWVSDRGEGIFRKIQRLLGLYDPREAILELAKGKLTTDPERHTGEGIFFSSKIFDAFDIRSDRLYFRHDDRVVDVLFEHDAPTPGTQVFMRLANATARTIKEVFDNFAAPEEFTFAKTVVPVKLAQYEGENLVSRSQAKRLYQRFERFQTVILDFAGVEMIGQGFADELFRVFVAAHPAVTLFATNTSAAVADMIKRVQA